MDIHQCDMYGNEIIPLGESGWGISIENYRTNENPTLLPSFNFFYVSDGFRQSAFSIQFNRYRLGTEHPGPVATNVFEDRCMEIIRELWMQQHPLPEEVS